MWSPSLRHRVRFEVWDPNLALLAGGLESPETVARLQATCGEGGDGLHSGVGAAGGPCELSLGVLASAGARGLLVFHVALLGRMSAQRHYFFLVLSFYAAIVSLSPLTK